MTQTAESRDSEVELPIKFQEAHVLRRVGISAESLCSHTSLALYGQSASTSLMPCAPAPPIVNRLVDCPPWQLKSHMEEAQDISELCCPNAHVGYSVAYAIIRV